MNKLFKLLGIALMAASMVFVSCNDDENTGGGSSQNNNMNLSDFNLAEPGHGPFYVTSIYCGEFSGEEQGQLMHAIANGTLYMDFYIDPSSVGNYYVGSRVNLVSGSASIQGFTIDKYDPETQTLHLCAVDEQNSYRGTVALTQDNEKIYFSWDGESIFPEMFEDATIRAYMLKSDLSE